MNNSILEKVQYKLQELKEMKYNMGVNLKWLDYFFEMLYQSGVKDELIEEILEIACDKDLNTFENRGIHDPKYVFNKNKLGEKSLKDNLNYLLEIKSKMNYLEFKDYLERILENIKKSYDKYYTEEQHTKKTNIFELFTKELILKNPQDVKIDKKEEKCGIFRLEFAGVNIGHIIFDVGDLNGENRVIFPEFRVNPGLERIGLGSYLFSDFCRYVKDMYPNLPVVATMVKYGGDGEKAYKAFGGEGIKCNDEFGIYYFDPTVVEQLSKKESKRYGKTRNIPNGPTNQ